MLLPGCGAAAVVLAVPGLDWATAASWLTADTGSARSDTGACIAEAPGAADCSFSFLKTPGRLRRFVCTASALAAAPVCSAGVAGARAGVEYLQAAFAPVAACALLCMTSALGPDCRRAVVGARPAVLALDCGVCSSACELGVCTAALADAAAAAWAGVRGAAAAAAAAAVSCLDVEALALSDACSVGWRGADMVALCLPFLGAAFLSAF